ncbi:MAG: hypothetical protein QM754_07125 [Tepidisphaeraceae bacterium]
MELLPPTLPPFPKGTSPKAKETALALLRSPTVEALLRQGARVQFGQAAGSGFRLTIAVPRLKTNPKSGVVASVPTSFDIAPFAGRWFHWTDIAGCFWPGRGGRAEVLNAELAPVRPMGGVYCFATSKKCPLVIGPMAKEARYVGQTANFFKRMSQFAKSAGFWGERMPGHSGARRWPEGRTADTWVSFFPITGDFQPHVATGLRVWMEAVALEQHRLAWGELPDINRSVGSLKRIET